MASFALSVGLPSTLAGDTTWILRYAYKVWVLWTLQ